MADDRSRSAVVLVELGVVMIEGVNGPRLIDGAPAALGRIDLVGTAVMLAPDSLLGRALPRDRTERIELVRRLLGDPALPVVESVAMADGRADPDAASRAWHALVRATGGRWLITDQAAATAPARRSGLRVIHIGTRGSSPQAAVEPAEHEARDVLDAISHILTAETFAVDAIA